MNLTGEQDELIGAVAAVQPNTIVVVNAGSVVAMDWSDGVAAILLAWYPGQECGNAIADVLFGRVDACGRLPTTIPVRYEDNPAYSNYPGADGEVRYEEGVFVGYRHYDAKDVAPRFPFGHGLSYTTVDYGPLEVDRDGDDVIAYIDITNTGERPGKDVVQLYVADVESSLPRPAKELKAFEKIALASGETKSVRFVLDRRAFSFWRDGWVLEPGEFELLCGASSRDIRSRARVKL